MSDFTERFKSYTNTELLRIIENPEDYQPLAVDAAKEILSGRQLSDIDMEAARNELLREKQAKLTQAEKIENIEKKIITFSESVIGTLNPVQTKVPSTDRIINFVSIGFVILFVFQIVKDFDTIRYAITDSSTSWDFSMILYFFPLIIIPLAVYLFYKRKKAGWILLSVILTYIAAGALSLFALTLNEDPSENLATDNVFPPVSPVTYLLSLIIFGGTLMIISGKNIREIYRIKKTTMLAIIIPVGILTILMNLGMFM